MIFLEQLFNQTIKYPVAFITFRVMSKIKFKLRERHSRAGKCCITRFQRNTKQQIIILSRHAGISI